MTSFTTEQHTNLLASFMPTGRINAANQIPETNSRKLLKGLATETKIFNENIDLFINDINPKTTKNFLVEWERMLAIPDECIPLATTDQARRDNIVLKLASLSLKTEEDYVNLGLQFGFTIVVKNESCRIPFRIPKLIGSEDFLNNTVILEGNYSSNPANAVIFQCLVEKTIPANGNILFETCSV